MKSRKHLGYLILAFLLSVILWNIPYIQVLVYPFNIFATYIHEFCHALMVILTGGDVLNIQINHDTSGFTSYIGGIRWLIVPAGYLGNALIGGLLLIIAAEENPKISQALLYIISIIMIACLAFFVRDLFSILVTIAFICANIAIAAKTRPAFSQFYLGFLGVQSSFYSLKNIQTLIGLSIMGSTQNDAAAMQELTHIPAAVWAIVWLGLSIAVFAGVVHLIYKYS